jgi:hypothetical protein
LLTTGHRAFLLLQGVGHSNQHVSIALLNSAPM